MDHEMHFRALLIKLQDNLSDSDRCRLHFLFGNIIPRNLRDDPSISGTLNLLEVLFDRGLIDDNDFDYLIKAFEEIQRTDIVKRLQEHARELRNGKKIVQPKALEQEHDDVEEDKIRTIGAQSISAHYKPDPKKNTNCTQFSLSNVPEMIITRNDVVEHVLKFNCRDLLNKWIRCRIKLIACVVSVIAFIILLVFTIVSIQTKLSKDSNINSHGSFSDNAYTIPVSPVVAGYFAGWSIGRNYSFDQIPMDKLTHIIYAFARIDVEGHIALDNPERDINITLEDDKMGKPFGGNFKQLADLKKKYPSLRTLISVGGDNYSEEFKIIVMNNESRSAFAASCVQFLKKYDFDGVDLDWKDPMSDSWPNPSGRPEDKQRNLLLFLEEFRRQIDEVTNRDYLLTLTTGVNPDHLAKMNLSSIAGYVNWINILTYNFHNYQDLRTGHNAPLYKNDREATIENPPSTYRLKLNCDAAIQAYITGGVPLKKLVMGIPLYGRGWKVANNHTSDGFLESTKVKAPNGTWEDVFYDYDQLKQDYLPSYTRFWDNQSKVPFLYNRTTGVWISYDDLESTYWKAEYVKQKRLRGVFFWELSKNHNGEIVDVAFKILTKTARLE